ncbi:hypothetical protein [Tautonia rosea]|uniref:hypothetical protein n=1 Tax=Tautonia rosea TaxID=2728037 RepID=UPI001473CBB7|nr:hypothetical protein [Tautonia rosea]
MNDSACLMGNVISGVAGAIVVTFGLWLIGLAGLILVAPDRAEAFLMAFARSARVHVAEQVLRLIAGVGIIIFSPLMMFPAVFRVFGWLMVLTAVGLLLLPWRWHRRFAERVIPPLIRHSKLFAVGAFALGALILFSAFPR